MTKKFENKDLDLKVLCKLLFNKMGYCTHYEMQLRTKSYINHIKLMIFLILMFMDIDLMQTYPFFQLVQSVKVENQEL